MYGVLTVYSAETVDEEDHLWSAVKDIGNIVGHAINTYETKTALVSDRVTEVRFRVADPVFPAVRFASAVDGSVAFENATTQEEGPHRVYVSVRCEDIEDTEERRAVIEEVAETTPLISSYSHVTTRDDAEVYSLVGDISFFHQILDRSGTLMEMKANEEQAEILVELPRYASVKSFVSMVEGEYDDVEVLSTRTKEKEFKTESGFKGELREKLTERQLETLQTAYYSGYFESPRECTGQEIAEQLGVTQPTVTENIKAGQSKLLRLLFDE
jgi:predicted DNA binding protein